MISNVTLNGLQANDVMIIVRQLREQGYVQGIDFDFQYFHSSEGDHTKRSVFTFYKGELATWFALRYQ